MEAGQPVNVTRPPYTVDMDENRPLGEIDFCAFDVETTDSEQGVHLVELGASRFRLAEECGEPFTTLVNPGVPISPFVIDIHGITDDMVRDAPYAPQALEAFFAFAEDCVLLAHNASFDTGVVSQELTRHAMPVPGFPILDTLSLARRYLRDMPDYRLSTLAERLGLFTQCAHRGLPDALAARDIFRASVKSIEGWEGLTLASLMRKGRRCAFQHYSLEGADLPPHLEIIREARKVRIVYAGGSRGPAPRLVTPRYLYESNGRVYLRAYCHESCVVKHYLVERIAEVREPEE